MEIAPQLPHCPDFGPKKQFPVQVLRRQEMTCVSKLKPHIHNNDDPWEKIHHYKYWNSLDRYPIGIFAMNLLYREFQYLKWWFFSHESSLLCTRIMGRYTSPFQIRKCYSWKYCRCNAIQVRQNINSFTKAGQILFMICSLNNH